MSTSKTRTIKINARSIQHKLLKVYRELRQAKTTYVVSIGGGGSGKSYSHGQFFVRRLIEERDKKLLIVRKTASTHKLSTFEQMKEACRFWGLKENVDYVLYRSNPEKIHFPLTNSTVYFKGLDDPEKIKSVVGINYVWVEEASEITKLDWKILNDRIRGEPQIYLSMNPIDERHWVKKFFYDYDIEDFDNITEEQKEQMEKLKSKITYTHSTYLDNPFVGQKTIDAMEWYRVNDPEHYQIYGLGQWGSVSSERPFFVWQPKISIRKASYNPSFPVELSFDFNIKYSCVVRQSIGKKKIYLEEYHADVNVICEQLAIKYGRNEIRITGDKSGNNRTQFTTGDRTHYQILDRLLSEKIVQVWRVEPRLDFSYVPKKNNLEHKTSRAVCNTMIHHWGEDFIISDSMKLLISDLKLVEVTPEGTLDKELLNRRDIGHLADAFRYSISGFDYKDFMQLGLYQEKSPK